MKMSDDLCLGYLDYLFQQKYFDCALLVTSPTYNSYHLTGPRFLKRMTQLVRTTVTAILRNSIEFSWARE
jgi:hypothetical protein